MVLLLSELWRFAAYLLRPEDTRDTDMDGPDTQVLPSPPRATATLRGAAKALFWAGLGVLAGLALGSLR